MEEELVLAFGEKMKIWYFIEHIMCWNIRKWEIVYLIMEKSVFNYGKYLYYRGFFSKSKSRRIFRSRIVEGKR